MCLSVAFEGFAVVALPGGSDRRPQLVGSVTLGAQTPVGFAGGCQTPQLPVLVHWVHNPVDARVLQ